MRFLRLDAAQISSAHAGSGKQNVKHHAEIGKCQDHQHPRELEFGRLALAQHMQKNRKPKGGADDLKNQKIMVEEKENKQKKRLFIRSLNSQNNLKQYSENYVFIVDTRKG